MLSCIYCNRTFAAPVGKANSSPWTFIIYQLLHYVIGFISSRANHLVRELDRAQDVKMLLERRVRHVTEQLIADSTLNGHFELISEHYSLSRIDVVQLHACRNQLSV